MPGIESGSGYIPPVERVGEARFSGGQEHEKKKQAQPGKPKGVLGAPDSFEKTPEDKFGEFLGVK